MAGLGDYSKKAKGSRGWKMKGFSGFKQTEGPVKPKSIVAAEEEEVVNTGDVGSSDESPEHYKLHFGRRAKQQFDFRDSRPDEDDTSPFDGRLADLTAQISRDESIAKQQTSQAIAGLGSSIVGAIKPKKDDDGDNDEDNDDQDS